MNFNFNFNFPSKQYIWEQLYDSSPMCGREVGTLYNLRQQFRMVNVYKDVKKNYKSAELLILSATKAYLCCAFMQWAGMEKLDGPAVNVVLPLETSSHEEKENFLSSTIGKFVEEFVLVECDVEKAWREQQEHKRQQQRSANQSLSADAPTTCTSSSGDPELTTGNNH